VETIYSDEPYQVSRLTLTYNKHRNFVCLISCTSELCGA